MRLHPEGSVSGQVCQPKLEIFGNVLYVLGDFEDPDSCIIEAVPDKDKLICEPMFSLMDETDLLKENPEKGQHFALCKLHGTMNIVICAVRFANERVELALNESVSNMSQTHKLFV